MDHKNIPLCDLHFLPMKHTKITVSQTTGLGFSLGRLDDFQVCSVAGCGRNYSPRFGYFSVGEDGRATDPAQVTCPNCREGTFYKAIVEKGKESNHRWHCFNCEQVDESAYYFRVNPANQPDYVLCVRALDQDGAEGYVSLHPGVVSWESITREQLPAGIEFHPEPVAVGVWQSKTSFTPLGPRPVDPRDSTATRNP
jgi:hypothetical protein